MIMSLQKRIHSGGNSWWQPGRVQSLWLIRCFLQHWHPWISYLDSCCCRWSRGKSSQNLCKSCSKMDFSMYYQNNMLHIWPPYRYMLISLLWHHSTSWLLLCWDRLELRYRYITLKSWRWWAELRNQHVIAFLLLKHIWRFQCQQRRPESSGKVNMEATASFCVKLYIHHIFLLFCQKNQEILSVILI